jgi:type IV pilus assembly protein PilN
MAHINLLPWREEYRQNRKKEFFQLLGGVLVLSALVILIWGRWVNARVDSQTSRNDLLTREIAALDEKIAEIGQLKERRKQMLARMEVIQALQGNRAEIVRVLDEFVRVTPDGVVLIEMKRVAGVVSLVGFAESNNRISSLMRQLDASDKFQEPTLTKVEANDMLGEQGSRFELQVKLTARIPDAVTEAKQ